MSRFSSSAGIRSYRKAASVLVGSTLLFSTEAYANDVAASGTATAATTSDAAENSEGADPIIVTGAKYRINTLNSRLPDVRDAPQSISIVPREIIEQQAATTLNDVLRNVSGISMAAGEGGGGPAGDNLTLRGFGARNDIFVDGIRDFASYTRDTFNVEQVEVVKGPASAQTGRGSTGGYINMFSKQPKLGTFVSGTVGVGLPGYVRGTADVNVGGDRLGLGGGTALRVNLLYHEADTPGRDHVETKRWGIAPSIAAGLGTSTRAILSYFRLEGDNQPDYGIPFVPDTNTALPEYHNKPAPVDYDNYYGLTERDYEDTVTNIATFALEHDITSDIRIANTTRYGYATRDSIYSSPRFAVIPSDPPTTNTGLLVNPQTQSRDTVDKVLLNQSNLFAKFQTGSVRHDAIAGFEISSEKSRNQLRLITDGTPTNIFDPDPERPWDGTVVHLPGEVVHAKADTVAAYVFDTAYLTDQILITGGLRWEHNKSEFDPAPSQLSATVGPIDRSDSYLTWRAGITYKPIRTLSLYAGAGTSVNPSIENLTQTTPTEAQGALKPEHSRTFEVGSKWDGFGGKLLVTTALFRTEKTNARTPGLPGEPAMVLEGEQRVDGFEFGATGRITERWQLVASYTYLDSEVIDSNTITDIGNRLGNVPKNSGSLWTLYTFPQGIEIGGGVRYVGARYTNTTNTRKVDDYWVADATFGYDISKKVTLRLNAFNLFDKRYADSLGGGHFVPGAGRSAVATLAFGL
ncbi:TonB-dependent siderophore receptor [Sphingomonas sp. SM33]|uniref:TonB-dependent siderophore receptor n=1 Tax=Sphingomonas telluris TaxID=2907998 RepID=A0ABS9VN64_9SPHN|nr:TonB-dependent siderophore receptor [Sphingomonas telluris]